MTPFGVDHSDGLNIGNNPKAVNSGEPVPMYELWHVGESRFNGRDGKPLRVACMRNTRTGKEMPVLYSRAYGLDSLRHAHSAVLVDPPEGWVPNCACGVLAEKG